MYDLEKIAPAARQENPPLSVKTGSLPNADSGVNKPRRESGFKVDVKAIEASGIRS